MDNHHSFNPTQPSFRNQLLTFTALGLVVFSLITSMMIAWLVSGMAQIYMTGNGSQVVQGFAERGVFALATGSAENGERDIEQVTSFPEVLGAKLVDSKGEILILRGDFNDKFTLDELSKVDDATLLFEDDAYWIFAASVIEPLPDSGGDGDDEYDDQFDSGFEDEEADEDLADVEAQKLGFALVKMSKAKLIDANRLILVYALLIGVGAVIVFAFLINYGLSRLTQPLLNLAQVMLDAEKTGAHLRAEVNGPREVQRMAHAYNSMMKVLDVQDEELRLHRDQLEAEVDIRTRELIEARDTALTANRHKSEFLANMTHELRTPIQSIIGYVDLVKEELEMEGLVELQEDLDKVTNNSRRLLTLINSVLDFAKVEAGKMDINLEVCSISNILSDVKDTIEPLVERNQNQLQTVGIDLREQVTVDKEKLEQVLVNLLSNACKFTQKGLVYFSAQLEGNDVLFIVKDTGIGISPDDLVDIFEEFQQVDGSQSRHFQGTGLGLAICKRFCELIGAQISVTSEINVGSTFSVRLPLKPIGEGS